VAPAASVEPVLEQALAHNPLPSRVVKNGDLQSFCLLYLDPLTDELRLIGTAARARIGLKQFMHVANHVLASALKVLGPTGVQIFMAYGSSTMDITHEVKTFGPHLTRCSRCRKADATRCVHMVDFALLPIPVAKFNGLGTKVYDVSHEEIKDDTPAKLVTHSNNLSQSFVSDVILRRETDPNSPVGALRCYGGNTAPGMSGAPLFVWSGNKFKIAGCHKGGSSSMDYQVAQSIVPYYKAWRGRRQIDETPWQAPSYFDLLVAEAEAEEEEREERENRREAQFDGVEVVVSHAAMAYFNAKMNAMFGPETGQPWKDYEDESAIQNLPVVDLGARNPARLRIERAKKSKTTSAGKPTGEPKKAKSKPNKPKKTRKIAPVVNESAVPAVASFPSVPPAQSGDVTLAILAQLKEVAKQLADIQRGNPKVRSSVTTTA
jgi:hypothetical protein